MHRPTLFLTITLSVLLLSSVGLCQKKKEAKPSIKAAIVPRALDCASAALKEEPLASLDVARPVVQFDATPDGSHWMAIDKFGLMQGIVIDGQRFPKEFNEIPGTAAQLSPNGKYVIWMGLTRGITERGFDSTVTSVYRNFDSLGEFVSDYNTLTFSRSGDRWGATLPYANATQKGDRDLVLVDGRVVGKNEPRPRLLTFSGDETRWAFRTTVGDEERLTTSDGDRRTIRLVKIPANNPYALVKDSAVWHYSPNSLSRAGTLEAYDYDFDNEPTATVRRTSYDPAAQDTARVYLTFGAYHSPLFRWIANGMMDSAGKHFGFLAAAPDTIGARTNKGLVIIDGKVVGGPYPELARLYMSPSGKHYAYTINAIDPELYVDGKAVAKARALQVSWSPDESRYAYIAVGSNQKVFVMSSGKRSDEYERIGRIGWSRDGKFVEYIALRNGKLLKIRQQI